MKNSVYRCFIAVCCFAVTALILTGCGTVTPQPPPPQPPAPPVKVQPPVVVIQTVEQIKFAPTEAHQKIADIKDSFKVYNSTKGRATGVYEYQELVYAIVNVDYGKEKIHRRLAKGTAMLRAKKMLQNTYKLPSRFNLRTHQLEAQDIYRQKIYRYAIVCRKSDINAVLDPNKAVVPAKPVIKKPAAAPAKPAVKKPAAAPAKPVIKKPAAAPAKPAVKKPAAAPVKPAVKKPAAAPVKPAVKKPAVKKAVVKKPAVAPAKKSGSNYDTPLKPVRIKSKNSVVLSGDADISDDF